MHKDFITSKPQLSKDLTHGSLTANVVKLGSFGNFQDHLCAVIFSEFLFDIYLSTCCGYAAPCVAWRMAVYVRWVVTVYNCINPEYACQSRIVIFSVN